MESDLIEDTSNIARLGFNALSRDKQAWILDYVWAEWPSKYPDFETARDCMWRDYPEEMIYAYSNPSSYE